MTIFEGDRSFDPAKCAKDKDGNLLAQTRDGLRVTLISIKGRGRCPLLGYIRDSSFLYGWRVDGICGLPNEESLSDLINIPEPKRSGEVWVNIYNNSGPTGHYNRGCADHTGGEDPRSKRIACVRVPWTEGEGLEGK